MLGKDIKCEPSIPSSKVFKILSIDGGGIKGLYSSRILERFESTFDCRIADYFDLVCGTSTGGLIALGISLNIPVREISEFYFTKGKKIFSRRDARLSLFKQIFLRGKYDGKGLKQALVEIFGNRVLADSNCLLCIPDRSKISAYVFIGGINLSKAATEQRLSASIQGKP